MLFSDPTTTEPAVVCLAAPECALCAYGFPTDAISDAISHSKTNREATAKKFWEAQTYYKFEVRSHRAKLLCGEMGKEKYRAIMHGDYGS